MRHAPTTSMTFDGVRNLIRNCFLKRARIVRETDGFRSDQRPPGEYCSRSVPYIGENV